MDILVVGRGVPTDKNPKLGIFELDQSKALLNSGLNVTYLGIDLRSLRRWRKWGISQKRVNGVNCYEINIPIGALPYSIRTFIGGMAFESFAVKYIKSKPDIIHAHFAKIAAIVSNYTRANNVPLVVTEHSSTMNVGRIKKEERKLAIKAYGCADSLITVSNALRNNILAETGFDSCVIPNIVQSDVFSNVQKRKHKGFGIISVGDLTYNKRHIKLIEVFARFHDTHRDSYLGIVGDGENQCLIENKIKELSLADCVKLYGRKTRTEIADILADYDCFALLSERETFGVAYIEAMAAGLPVIATKCGGPEDFVSDNNGILVEVDDIGKTLKALTYIYDNYEKYDTNFIRRDICNKFSDGYIASLLTEIYLNMQKK